MMKAPPGQYNVLVENGVLKGYMQEKLNARLMSVAPTGNGRRESYAHMPMPRMTNTYMLAGPHDPEEIISRWVARGWLLTSGRHRTKVVRIDGAGTRCFCLTRQASDMAL